MDRRQRGGGRKKEHTRLRRLDAAWYRGFAFVHWSMSIANRATGWLDVTFHQRFRELLLHSLSSTTYGGASCPVYCLMPDHLHLLVIGWCEEADQLKIIQILRRHLNAELQRSFDVRLQDQAYDNVLREEDREQDAVQRTAFYIAENPVRAGIANSAEAYSYTGGVVPGYPELDHLYWNDRGTEFWECFWRIYRSKLPP